MSKSIASFFTTIGFKVDESGLKQIQDSFRKIKDQVKDSVKSTQKQDKDLLKFQDAVAADNLRNVKQRLAEEAKIAKEKAKALAIEARSIGPSKELFLANERKLKVVEEARKKQAQLQSLIRQEAVRNLTAKDSELSAMRAYYKDLEKSSKRVFNEQVKQQNSISAARIKQAVSNITAVSSESKAMSAYYKDLEKQEKAAIQRTERRQTASHISQLRREEEAVKHRNRLEYLKTKQEAGGRGPNLPRLFAGVTTEVGASLAGFFGLTEFTRSLYNTQNLLFKLKTGLTAVTGSEKAAKAETDFLRQSIKDLSMDTESAVKGFLSLSGSAKGSKISQEQVRDLFVSTSKAISVFGLSADDAQGVFRALGQMISKGKVSAEELRLQLAERMPGAVQMAANAIHKTVPEMLAMMEKGQLLSEDLIPALAKEFEKVANEGNAFAESLKSPQAQMNRLKTSWFLFNEALGNSGLYAAMGAVIEGLTEAIVGMTPAFKTAILFIREWWDVLAIGIGAAYIYKITKGLTLLNRQLLITAARTAMAALPFIAIGAAAAALYLIVEDLIVALRGGESVIGDFAKREFGEDWSENIGIAASKLLLEFGKALESAALIGTTIAAWATNDLSFGATVKLVDPENKMLKWAESLFESLDYWLYQPMVNFFKWLGTNIGITMDKWVGMMTGGLFGNKDAKFAEFPERVIRPKGTFWFGDNAPTAPEAAKSITSPKAYGTQGLGPLAPATTITGGIQMNVTVPQGTTTDQAKSITEQFYDLISRESVSYPLQAAY